MQRLELAGIEVEALSVGGLETCIHLPRMKVAFDIGRCPPEVVARDTVLFTHGHMDHLGGIAYHCSTRALRHMRPPLYVVPRPYAAEVERLFEVWRRLGSDMPHEILLLAPGEEYALRSDLVVRPFPAYHTVPCQGYAIYSRREKLKPEHRGSSAAELVALKDRGVEITETVEVPEVAYCGDTRIDVVDRVPVVRQARVLIIEATFVDDRVSVEEARARGHVHLDEIVERSRLFRNEAILLHHFSARYQADEIVAALDARLPRRLRTRVIPLLGAH